MENISSFNFEDFDPFALPFVLASQKSKLPACPGIYFAIGGPRTILYIGSAKNIRNRWRNHNVYIFLAMAMVDARIAYVTAQDAGRLHIFEEELIKHFKPVLNATWNNKRGRLNVLDALDRLNEMEQLYSKETIVDRVSTAYLLKRYNLNSRTALINRLGALEIKPVREGNRFFVSADDMDKLDALNECLKRGNSLTECAIEVKSGIFKHDGSAFENGSKRRKEIELDSLPTSTADFTSLVHDIAAALRPQTDPLQHLECLERAAEMGWLLSTKEVRALIGVKPHGSSFERGSFTFSYAGKIGSQTAWRVEKS